MRILLKYNFIAALALLASVIGLYLLLTPHRFQIEDVTSSVPFRNDWEVSSSQNSENVLLNDFTSQPLTYLGEGGQSIAFASADGRYVLKLFKFNRFRPSAFFSFLPNLPMINTYRQHHSDKRQHKLELAFAGYKLAYEYHREESGLLFVQLNALPDAVFVTLKDRDDRESLVNLQHVPFIVQLKGEMLGTSLQQLLAHGDIAAAKHLLDQLIVLYRSEYAKGLKDLDRGLMHNIGSIEGERLFHLDVGKMVQNEQMKQLDLQQEELSKIALKVHHWLQQHAPAHASTLYRHMQSQIDRQGEPNAT